jgi:hypothetical protein
MAKYPKAASATIEKLKAELKAAKAAAAAKLKATKATASKKPEKKPKKAKKRQVYGYGKLKKTKKGEEIPGSQWEGPSPKKLTVYKVRLMLDEQQIGIFGPYATIRAASADAKNILRMHVGPNHQIEEIGTDEPVLRSDGNVKVYFHPTVYSGQATDKGVLTAQVIEQGGEAQRQKTFVKKYNPRRNGAAWRKVGKGGWRKGSLSVTFSYAAGGYYGSTPREDGPIFSTLAQAKAWAEAHA